ncbi:SapC family protein [Sphingomonas sp. DT-204]|uniref:SapC family protein n=1 Tax=Sphingomonas sp. DT-204 TaxID=3396166 RepID=UPI003F1DF76E
MSSPVLLNNVDHHDLRVVLGHGAAFGECINQVTVFPTEFEELQRDYAILFRRDAEGAYRSVVLLGLEEGENLYLDESGWTARYVPALVQRGPFSIGVPAAGAGGEPMIHVDLSHPRISRSEGEPVFLEHGGNAPYLDHIARVLQAIYVGSKVSKAMFAAFEEHGLLEPVTLDVRLGETRGYKLPDCYTIAPAHLSALDGGQLATLHGSDFLRPAIWAASSLRNITRLIEMKNRRDYDR